MVKFMLNLHKFNNYAFFCPVSRLHLTVSSPVGYTNEVTTAILRALKTETILDVDGVVDIETGAVKVKGATVTNSNEETNKQASAPKVKEEPAQEKISEPKKSEPENKVEEDSTDKVEKSKTEEKLKRNKRAAIAKDEAVTK